MSKKRIESYIPVVLDILKEEFPDGMIPSAYNGYISAFGASVLQSGLKPTLALFENTNANTRKDKSYLTKIILKALDDSAKQTSLLHYVLAQNNESYQREKIMDIAVAVKLCIRTFKLDRGDGNG